MYVCLCVLLIFFVGGVLQFFPMQISHAQNRVYLGSDTLMLNLGVMELEGE